MAQTHDLSEILKQLRTDLLADTNLTAMLGSTDAIYFGRPRTKAAYPLIVLSVNATNPQGDGGFTGLWRADLQLDILAVGSRYPCFAIDGYLQQAWSIPANRSTLVSSANFRLTMLRHVDTIDVPGDVRLTANDEPALMLSSEWRARITAAT